MDEEEPVTKVVGRYVPFSQLPYEVWEDDRLMAAFVYEEEYLEYLNFIIEDLQEVEGPAGDTIH
jgi:hypothetical protein